MKRCETTESHLTDNLLLALAKSGNVMTSFAMVILLISDDVTNAISSCPSSNSPLDRLIISRKVEN